MKYEHWIDSMSEETLKHVLKTVQYVLDDSEKELTENELIKLHYCWDIINHLQHLYNKDNNTVVQDLDEYHNGNTNPAAARFVKPQTQSNT